MKLIFRKISNRLRFKPQFTIYYVDERILDDSIPEFEARIPFDLEILPPDIQETEARLSFLPEEHMPDFPQRIKNGHRCFVAVHEGKIVYVVWTAFNKCRFFPIAREFILSEDKVYGYSSYTTPEYRGNSIYPAFQIKS